MINLQKPTGRMGEAGNHINRCIEIECQIQSQTDSAIYGASSGEEAREEYLSTAMNYDISDVGGELFDTLLLVMLPLLALLLSLLLSSVPFPEEQALPAVLQIIFNNNLAQTLLYLIATEEGKQKILPIVTGCLSQNLSRS